MHSLVIDDQTFIHRVSGIASGKQQRKDFDEELEPASRMVNTNPCIFLNCFAPVQVEIVSNLLDFELVHTCLIVSWFARV